MKQNKKGFTLIELLAVIVILAIIALIAVPVVMNIITKARKSASADTAYSVLNAAELYYANQLINYPTQGFEKTTIYFDKDGKACTVEPQGEDKAKTCDEDNVLDHSDDFEIKGTKPTGGSIELSASGVATLSNEGLEINGYTCTVKTGKNVITCE